MILLFLLTSYIADDGRWCTDWSKHYSIVGYDQRSYSIRRVRLALVWVTVCGRVIICLWAS